MPLQRQPKTGACTKGGKQKQPALKLALDAPLLMVESQSKWKRPFKMAQCKNSESPTRCFMSPGVTATFSVIHKFSRQHLEAARHFADSAVAIESEANLTERHRSAHRAYVTGAVICSVAFLEASINEFYLEAVTPDQNSLQGLIAQQLAILAEFWKIVERNSPILNKYQIALVACGAQAFDKGQDPFQSVDAIIDIRNALIRYRPEPSDDLRVHRGIENRVRGRFQLNPLGIPGSLWFPHLCLGSGCASWAILQVECFHEGVLPKAKYPLPLRSKAIIDVGPNKDKDCHAVLER